MHPHEHLARQGWEARLELDFERRGSRTVLARRRHRGPLVVQKAFYPEEERVCHAIVLHPPAGIAGGDRIELAAAAASHASVLLTTPGAAKWYRSRGPEAYQHTSLRADDDAVIEWLPQENIVFDGAIMRTECDIDLRRSSAFMGWEIVCFGRSAADERFTSGAARFSTRLRRDGRLIWYERGHVPGGGPILSAPSGFAGKPVSGVLLACGEAVDQKLLSRCRETAPRSGEHGVTMLPGLIVARHLGDSAEDARAWFVTLWQVLRPALTGRDAVLPRIWST